MKGKQTALVLFFLGVLLLVFGSFSPEETAGASAEDTEAYRAALTAEVTALCREVRGAGECTVLLTLEAGESRVYAEGASGGVLTAGGEGVLIECRPPRVLGVAVVCEGGGDPAVREELASLLSASLGVGAHKVRITAKK
ncbi:MAG: hypothetical protein IJF73_07445 [Clostridia bacterium]|nr:hypothetical protein [Clostridia bacterium]